MSMVIPYLDISLSRYLMRIISLAIPYLDISSSGYTMVSHEGNSLSRYLLIMRLALILEGAGMEMSQKLMWIMILLSKYVYCTKCKKLITKKNICTNLLCTLGDRNNKRLKYICSTIWYQSICSYVNTISHSNWYYCFRLDTPFNVLQNLPSLKRYLTSWYKFEL